ncbi:MAG: RNase adapter RapZ [Proteobacteria bacterium]|nr:RNase adapter RapZ [Pseudomonadota bacterium]
MNDSGPVPAQTRVVLVTGLSGGGKASALRALEDLGYAAIDNPPLDILEELVRRQQGRCAVGVDARTRGFDAEAVSATVKRLQADPAVRPELLYMWADEATLLRRYTETRRRHPLAPQGRVADGIAEEIARTAPLRELADLIIDTSDLPLPALRRLVERHFGAESDAESVRMVVSLISFSYAHGLPREADLVFDARFLRNPHYVPTLRPLTGIDPEVGAFVAADPDYPEFFDRLAGLVGLLLPRFVQEGKKYATIAIGCTGGRHRSVYTVERLAAALARRIASGGAVSEWRLYVTHRELAREGNNAAFLAERSVPPDRSEARQNGKDDDRCGREGPYDDGDAPAPVRAQEA